MLVAPVVRYEKELEIYFIDLNFINKYYFYSLEKYI